MLIQEYLIKKVLDTIISTSKSLLKGTGYKLLTDKSDIENAVNAHIQSVKNWSTEVTFKDLTRPKSTFQIYIDLDLFVAPRKSKLSAEEAVDTIPLTRLIESEKNHIVLLGQPGAGKTTSMKYICQQMFFNEDFNSADYNFPVFIKLRDFNKRITKNDSGLTDTGILVEHIFNLFGLKVDSVDSRIITQSQVDSIKRKLVSELLNKLQVILILDGFDEIPYSTHKDIVIEEIEYFVQYLDKSKILLTSRSADYNYSTENIAVYEVCSLNEMQIGAFAERWILPPKSPLEFLDNIKKSPFWDTAIRPLTLAHLCAIYERLGRIPDKPKTVYKKIVSLLIEEWDEQRNIKRESKYSEFEIDRKLDFLSNLSFQLTIKKHGSVFSRSDLESIYAVICDDFDLPLKECKKVVSEIESHNGLVLQSGFENYEFAHKSLQEYLAAEYIKGLPELPDTKRLYLLIPNELAIAVSISSNPSAYFENLVYTRFLKLNLDYGFIKTFINRLLLEKPDFNRNSKVGKAAILLYSLFIEHNTTNQLTLFFEDSLIFQYEELIKIISKRNDLQIIYSHYAYSRPHSSTISGDQLIKMFVKADTRLPHDLPPSMYARESFLQSLGITIPQ